MTAQAVLALQTIASRNADPIDQVVVSVTSFETSSKAFNVIPQTVQIKGTVRTMSKEMRDLAEKRIKEICNGVAATFGGTGGCDLYSRVSGHGEQRRADGFCCRGGEVGIGQVAMRQPLVMGGEDFAFMLEERPGAYILVGNGDTAMVHHPEYNFNDEAIPAGCSWWAEIVEQRMPAA